MEVFIKKGKISHLRPHFITYRETQTATTPDIVLLDNKLIHNIQIRPGPLTTSDHIPNKTEVTQQIKLVRKSRTLNIQQADWEAFQEELIKGIEEIDIEQHMNQTDIDEK